MHDEILFVLNLLGGIFCFAVGLAVGSLLGAIWLRLAARWLRYADIPYFVAFRHVLLANFVTFTISFSVGINYSVSVRLIQFFSDQRQRVDFTYGYTPTFFLISTIFGLIS